jgi:hypothetical protein
MAHTDNKALLLGVTLLKLVQQLCMKPGVVSPLGVTTHQAGDILVGLDDACPGASSLQPGLLLGGVLGVSPADTWGRIWCKYTSGAGRGAHIKALECKTWLHSNPIWVWRTACGLRGGGVLLIDGGLLHIRQTVYATWLLSCPSSP